MSFSIERPSLVDPENRTAGWPEQNGGKALFGDDGPSFEDLLDAINPLQHLPIVGTIYRALTGDRMSDGARLAGGALYGGPVGLVAAMAGIGYEQATGRGLEDAALAVLRGDESLPSAEAAVKTASIVPEPASPAPTAAPLAASPVATPAAGPAGTPPLSPEAFEALMRSVNRQPSSAPAAAAGRPLAWSRPVPASAPVEMPPAVRAAVRGGLPQVNPIALAALSQGAAAPPPPAARQAGLELHDALRQYAQQKGRAGAP